MNAPLPNRDRRDGRDNDRPNDRNNDRQNSNGALVDTTLFTHAAAETNTTIDAVMTARNNGQSVADYVTQNGGSVAEVEADAVLTITNTVNAAVENGRITREEGDEIVANVPMLVNEAINSTEPLPNPERQNDRRGQQPQRDFNFNIGMPPTIAENLGITIEELRAELQSGKTFNEIIEEHGGDVELITQAVIDNAIEVINQAVADGQIDQPTADQLLANLETEITQIMSRPLNQGRRDQGFGSDGSTNGVLE